MVWRTGLLILQPTPFCNIDCRYCYLPDRTSTRRMRVETVAATLRSLQDSGLLHDELTVVWHAGEPLAAPLAFFEQAFALVNALAADGLRVNQAIQTNLTLLTEAHCAVLKEHRVHVGVSLDGPARFHDAQRVTRSGRGTFDAVMRGVALLRAADVPFNVISVLTRASLDHPDELYDFFASVGAREVAFNVDEQEGTHTRSSIQGAAGVAAYRAFMTRILERSAGGELNVREIRHLDALIAREELLASNNQVEPYAILSVGWQGDYATFSPELLGVEAPEYDGFVLGNVHDGPVIRSAGSDRFRRLGADIAAGVAACRASCEHFGLCGGGAPSNKWHENGSMRSTDTAWCRLTKQAMVDVYLAAREAELGLSG